MVGRGVKCNLEIKDEGLSRVQCRIDFINDIWSIRDGDGEKGSTNGTWLFADRMTLLKEGVIVKAGQAVFQVNMIE